MRVSARTSGMDRHRRLGTGQPRASTRKLVADGGVDREDEEPTDVDETDGDTESDASDADVDTDADADADTDSVADADKDNAADADDSAPDVDADPTAEPGTPAALEQSNVEVHEPGTADPADPKWEKPDPDDIPEFEVRAGEPMAESSDPGGPKTSDPAGPTTPESNHDRASESDPTAGMPNAARSPGDARIQREGTEGYVAALELAARLPEDVRLPEEAADLVPAAVEAELEQDVQSFAAAEFDEESPHVDVLEFVERDGEIWLRLRLGIPTEAFADLDPDEVRAHALQELDGLL